MKSILSILSAFLISINLYAQEEVTEIPLQYDTSGYAENSSQGLLANRITSNPLAPTVNAEMNVNDGGALTYMLPIEILKGVNNFQPNVALAYNSQSGNGQAGWGWNIVGLSTITRGGKSKEIDGLTIGPQFNDSDPFYLDGQRLIKINDTDFVTEKFSKIKITKPASGEFSFIVRYTDGKIAKYKELTPGQHYITVMLDAYDNEIHYTYQTIQNVTILTKISYGGTDVSNDKFYINFIYKNRAYPINIYRNNLLYSNIKILSEINSGSTYDQLYRKYTLYHDFIENGNAERVRGILVENKDGEPLKPLSFNYNTSTDGNIKIYQHTNGGIGTNVTGLGSVAVGNFTGKGDIEAVYQTRLSNGKYDLKTSKGGYLPNTNYNSSTEFYSGKILTAGNKITDNDQIITVNINYLGNPDLEDPDNPVNETLEDEISFITKDLITGSEKTVKYILQGGLISRENFHNDPYDENGNYNPSYVYYRDHKREFHSGDFNNDGLVDFLIVEPKDETRNGGIYFAEVGKAALNGGLQPVPVKLSSININLDNTQVYPIEFDGDGIPELMVVTKNTGKYNIYKINFSNNTLDNIYANQTLPDFGYDTPIFFGDFNGDGLTDFITPKKVYKIEEGDDDGGYKIANTYYDIQNDTLLWWKYTSTGTQFEKHVENYTQQKIFYIKPAQNNVIKHSTFWQKFWNGLPDEYAYTRYSTHNIIITDYDGDGRSDILTLNKIGNAKYTPDGKLANTTIDNIGNTFVRVIRSNSYPFIQFQSFNSSVTNQVNLYLNKSASGGTFVKQKSVSIVDTQISPLSLILGNTDFNQLNTYQSGFFIHDPITKKNTKLVIDNSSFLEKQIQEVDNGSSVIQKVEYRNMVNTNLPDERTYIYEPLDDLNYPYYTHSANGSLYLVNKIHTVFDGKILTKEYRFENGIQHLEGKGFLGFRKTYVSDAYESVINNGKYRIKDPFKAVFWNIQTKDPLMDNSIAKSTYGGLKKFFTENTNINKKYDRGNHQYLILSTDEVSKDYLKKITINKKYVYVEQDDLKLKTAYTDYDGIGSTVSEYTYKSESTNGDHYFYGKIESVRNTTYKDGLSFTTKTVNDYNDRGNLSESSKYGNDANAPPVVTSYAYDAVGNIITQTLYTQGIFPQVTSYEYDTTKRYVTKTTTPDGLFSTAVVNALGRVSEETAPLGLKTYYTYDSWGNITNITDYLGKTTTITKAVAGTPAGAVYSLSKKRDGGTESIVTFDKFDREIESKTQSANNKWVVARTEYDIFGRKVKYTEPFFEGDSPKWNEVEYDELSRPVKNKIFTGKTITTCYEGMKVTVDDGYKKTSKTLDAMGNTIRHQDHGGVIGYAYYPNGALRETNYEGVKTTFEIDGWDNKTKITDPSAGIFTYEYDNLSRITKETNPKGYTLYTYDALGRPLTEKTYGNSTAENTNIEKTYTYNANTKLPETITGTSNGQTFTYTTYYDQYYRITGKKEQTPDFTYTSTTTFDSFGRADVVSISTTLNNPSLTSASSVKNVYDANGILVQQNNNATGTMIWHISDINAQGQTKQMEYGNGYVITNDYRATDGSLTDIRHVNSTTGISVMDIGYNYDVNKGVLLSRNNRTFGKDETYEYDVLNRLLAERVNNVLVNEYTYDNRGRITSNTELGKYNYESGNYKLQNIAFNANGQDVNTQRGFAGITYNAFKSPLNITLAGKDNLSFDYNILKTRYKMSSSVTGVTKLYSSDFAIEIVKSGNRTEIITYITGDPYNANYIKKTVKNKNILSESYYYLHRDNLGSILAITDNDGVAVEKRYFDAWGNLKALTDADGQMITNARQLRHYEMFIDRGYTGHEHLQSIGLINMNARIYDPVLRKFLSPDNYVQDPSNTQSYDRYSYVFNNPLLYIDPSGDIGFLAIVLIGVAVGVMTNGIANMINGIPFWYGMGKAGVMGGVAAAISFGIGALQSSITGMAQVAMSTQEAILSGLGQVIGAFLPSWEVHLGDWTFSLNVSLYLGKSVGVGLSGSLSYSDGHFSASYGIGLTGFAKHYGTGKSGWEMRNSFMLQYGSKEFSLFVGTNFWGGNAVDKKSQQTGIVGIQSGKTRIAYENDGSPFDKKGMKGIVGDGEDRFRTAAVRIAIGEFQAGINLFTGERNSTSYQTPEGEACKFTNDDFMMENYNKEHPLILNGVNYRYGLVEETGPRYRLGAGYIGWGNYRFGIDSDMYIRRPFQNWFAHSIVSPQPGFEVLNFGISPFLQYQTNNKFTSW